VEPVARVPFRLEADPGVVRGDIRLSTEVRSASSGNGRSDAALVVCHGFKGFKDWGFWPTACEQLATRLGCPVVSFNFSGSGVGSDLGTFSDPEGFATNTFSRETADLVAVLDGLAAGRLGEAELAPPARVGLVGHSRGAVSAVLVGSRRPEVRAIATWAGLARPGRYADLFPADGDPDLPAEVRNLRTGEVLPLRRDVLDDLQAQGDLLDPLKALRSGRAPLLVLHGENDEAVSMEDAKAYAAAGPDADLQVLESTGHTFDIRHPFAGSTPALEMVISHTVSHFRRHISKEQRHGRLDDPPGS
jgi:pimeloyl-ACP methyl ester carboxylesterase